MNTPRCLMLLCCCLVFAAVDARAEDLVLGLHTFSIHSPQHGQNNVNQGLYLRYGQWQAGGFFNSHERTSLYAGYALPVGPFELVAGLSSGYKRVCTDTSTHIPEQVAFEKHENGDTSKTTTPAQTVPSESCVGFAKHALTPLAAVTYAAPFTVFNARPRLWVMPGFKRVSTVIHASLEWSIK